MVILTMYLHVVSPSVFFGKANMQYTYMGMPTVIVYPIKVLGLLISSHTMYILKDGDIVKEG